jgi:hypothetical protein
MKKPKPGVIAPSPNDLADAQRLAPIIREVNDLDIPRMDVLLGRLVQSQPFVMSMLLGYHAEHTPHVFEAIARCVLIVWRFHESTGRDTIPIGQEQYERTLQNNMAMLKYAEGGSGAEDAMAVYRNDITAMRGKAVLAALQGIVMAHPALHGHGLPAKGQLMLELKTLIDCYDAISAQQGRQPTTASHKAADQVTRGSTP